MARNFDYPMPMQGWAAKQMLWQVQQDAAALYAALRNDDRLPAWTLQKLAQGSDRIGVAARYLLYKINENTPSYGYGADEAAKQEAPKGPRMTRGTWIALGLGAALIYGMHTTLGGFSGPPRRVRKNPAKRRNGRDSDLRALSDLGFVSIVDGIREGASWSAVMADLVSAEQEADPDTDPDVFSEARALIRSIFKR